MNSNTSSTSMDPDIVRQTADLVARLYSGNMSAAEEEAFNIWLSANPAHRLEYERMLDIWDDLDALAGDPELGTGDRGRSLWRRWALVASAVLSISLFTYWIQRPDPNGTGGDFTAYSTGVGEQRVVTLADGSRITLNTNSSIRIGYSGAQRRAVLDKGEVFFDIAKDRFRPFTVEMGTQTITVLGTRFNVYRRGAEVTVAVVEGVVAVHQKGHPLKVRSVIPPDRGNEAGPIIEAGDQYRLDAGAVMTFEERAEVVSTTTLDDSGRYREWHSGVVTFDDEPLHAVVQEINRYTDRKIMIADADIMDLRVSGVLHLREVDQVLLGLEQAFPLDITFSDEGVMIRRRPATSG
jgi:transmembrane sensor